MSATPIVKLFVRARLLWLSVKMGYLNWKSQRIRRGNMKLARRVEYLEAEIEQGPERMRQRMIDHVNKMRKP